MHSKPRIAALAITGLLSLGGVAACGSSSSGSSSAGAGNASSPSASASSSAAKPLAGPLTLTKGVHTQVALASSFLTALKTLKVTPGVTGTAKLTGNTLTFPITSGTATYYKPGSRSPYVVATIHHQGSGITLSAGGTTVGLSNFVVDATDSMLTGKVSATTHGKTKVLFAKGAPLFFLNGRTLQPLTMPTKHTAVLYGTKVYLTSTAAALLAKTYHLKAGTVSNQTLIGVAKITLGL